MPKTYYEEIIPTNQNLPFIFHTDSPTRHNVVSNWHESIEILYCISGIGKIRYAADDYTLKEGEIFVIESNINHCMYAISEDFTYRCLIIDKCFAEENSLTFESIKFKKPIRDVGLSESFEAIVSAFHLHEKYKEPKIRFFVLGFLIELYEKYSFFDENETNIIVSERIKAVITYLKQHYSEKISLDDIESYAKISRYHLSREFKRITEQTIFGYLNLIRCKEAKRMIKAGHSVSEAALSCGFENMSYFTRTYKKIIGEIPSDTKRGCSKMIL